MTDLMPFAELVEMLAAWKAARAATPFIFLFTNDVVPEEDVEMADLVEPTDDWYAREAAVYGETYKDADGRPHATIPSVQFNWTAAGGAGAATIYGYGIVSAAAAGNLLHVKRLAQPVTLNNVLSSIVVQPELALPAIGA